MRSTVNEQGGSRLVEVADSHGPLLDVMCASCVDVVSIEGRYLMRGAGPHELYVCASVPSRETALQFVLTLLSLAIGCERVRAVLDDVGTPRCSEVGDRVLIWWPDLKGDERLIH
jgi:hypothetical protein